MPQAKMNYFGTCITNTTEEKSVKTIHLSGFDTLSQIQYVNSNTYIED